MGGHGLYDLRTELGMETLKFLRDSLYTDSEAGNLIRINLDYSSQREAAVDFHLLEKPDRGYISYLTPSWVMSIRQFLGNNKMHLTFPNVHQKVVYGEVTIIC